MDNIIRKVLYTGVGLIAATTERLQKSVDDLVDRGKLSEEEGKKVVDDVMQNTETKREEYESRFRKIVDSALAKLNLPQADGYEKLEKRVKSLEVKLGLLIKEIEASRKGASPEAESNTGSRKAGKKTKVAVSQDSEEGI